MHPDEKLRQLAKLHDRSGQILQALHFRSTDGGFRLPTLSLLGVCAGGELADEASADVLADHPSADLVAPRVVALATLPSLPSHGGYEIGEPEKG